MRASKTESLGHQDLFNKELRCGEIVREFCFALYVKGPEARDGSRRSCDNAEGDTGLEGFGDAGSDNGRLKYW